MIQFRERVDGDDRYLQIFEDPPAGLTELYVCDSLVKGIAKPWPKLTRYHFDSWTESKTFGQGTVVTRHILHPRHHSRSTPGVPFQALRSRIASRETHWGDGLVLLGEFRYTKGYWEWAEDVLSRCQTTLHMAKIYDAVYASLYTYDCIPDMVRAFCESWSPSTNTLVTFVALWDLHHSGGLPILGELFDEVVPSFHELKTYTQGMERCIPESCGHLLRAFHLIYQKKSDDQVSINDWIKFGAMFP